MMWPQISGSGLFIILKVSHLWGHVKIEIDCSYLQLWLRLKISAVWVVRNIEARSMWFQWAERTWAPDRDFEPWLTYQLGRWLQKTFMDVPTYIHSVVDYHWTETRLIMDRTEAWLIEWFCFLWSCLQNHLYKNWLWEHFIKWKNNCKQQNPLNRPEYLTILEIFSVICFKRMEEMLNRDHAYSFNLFLQKYLLILYCDWSSLWHTDLSCMPRLSSWGTQAPELTLSAALQQVGFECPDWDWTWVLWPGKVFSAPGPLGKPLSIPYTTSKFKMDPMITAALIWWSGFFFFYIDSKCSVE